jgi:hypothetical protein
MYPIYIVSKGRFKNPLTAKYFASCSIDYLIAVEPQEYEDYCKILGSKYVLKLPFKNLGFGSFPARNYCWEDAKQKGFNYYWCFDDNISCFDKWIDGKKQKYKNGIDAIKYVEIFATINKHDISGFEYRYFVAKPPKMPFKFNTHVYSAMLIKTSLPYRWRLKYNEDIDLCLNVLHHGGKTSSCIYYMIRKTSTVAKMKGGNQDELYKNNDKKKLLLKAKMIERVWPQYAKTVIRFGRYHHLIDWKQFNKKL